MVGAVFKTLLGVDVLADGAFFAFAFALVDMIGTRWSCAATQAMFPESL